VDGKCSSAARRVVLEVNLEHEDEREAEMDARFDLDEDEVVEVADAGSAAAAAAAAAASEDAGEQRESTLPGALLIGNASECVILCPVLVAARSSTRASPSVTCAVAAWRESTVCSSLLGGGSGGSGEVDTVDEVSRRAVRGDGSEEVESNGKEEDGETGDDDEDDRPESSKRRSRRLLTCLRFIGRMHSPTHSHSLQGMCACVRTTTTISYIVC
jgi:hypothetical protein